jgi:hypothetical protein
MDVIHLHLLLNHVPLIGAIGVILLLGLALLRNSGELGKVALGFLVLLGAVAGVVFLTGEPTEELVERLPGVSETIMEAHEEVALVATIAMGGLAALALAALVVYRHRTLPRWVGATGMIGTIGVVGIMAYTANLGGQIRHTEIRPGGVAQAPAVEHATGGAPGERDDH